MEGGAGALPAARGWFCTAEKSGVLGSKRRSKPGRSSDTGVRTQDRLTTGNASL